MENSAQTNQPSTSISAMQTSDKPNNGNKRSKILSIIAALGLYFFTTGISYAAFNYLRTPPDVDFVSPLPEDGSGLIIDPSEPRTEPCPLNGELFTKTEKQVWKQRRPLAIMIENHTDSRPQSGLSSADVVYEAVAEGGITRFLALYLCDAIDSEKTIGPVRSARTYYLDWASEYGETPLYVHVGGANTPGPADALGQIQDYGWGGRNSNDLNQFSIGYPTFWRDQDRLGRTVATEHTMYSTTEKLWKVGKDRGWTNLDAEEIDWQEHFQPWTFSQEEKEGEPAVKVEHSFWDGYKQFQVTWQYNPESGMFQRFNGGEASKDLNNDQQLSAKVVIVQFVTEKGPIDELKHLLYKTIGTGKAIVFQDGKAVNATWKKADRTERTIFTASGKEIEFSPGKIWIEIVPTGKSVDY